jgi:AcrR family transcriptional regulator
MEHDVAWLLDAIASEAGSNKTSFYRSFRSKEELLA